jgi:Rhs element Vgr protein
MSKKVDFDFDILVDGKNVEHIEHKVAKVIVDTTIGMPSMVHIILEDTESRDNVFDYIDSNQFDIGKKIEIKVNSSVNDSKKSLFKGTITAIEPDFIQGGSVQLHIRGYDDLFKLSQGKRTRTFLNMKDSEIVSKIAGDVGLTVDADATSVLHEHVYQLDQTDWDFLQSRAKLCGCWIGYKNDKLCFKKVSSLPSDGLELEWGNTLSSFRLSYSALGQSSKSNAYGWDVKEKKEIVSNKTPSSSNKFHSNGVSKTGGAVEKTLVGRDLLSNIYDQPVADASDADGIAESNITVSESHLIQAEGYAVGDPSLVAGTVVELKGLGTRYSGKYLVTQARHELHHGKYIIWFSNHGITPETISGLLSSDRQSDADVTRIDGVVPAIVTNNNDSQGKYDAGKVKLKFPWMPSENSQLESQWARVASIGGGNQRGLYFMPEVNDEVLVAFEQGDINRPYVIGGLWNGKDKPPEALNKVVASGKVNLRMIKTRSGHQILFDDTDGSEKITIVDKTNNNSVVIDSKNNTVTITSKADMVFDSGGKLTLNCKGDFALNATGAAKMDSKAGVNITGVQAITVKSNQSVTVQNAAGNKLDLSPAGATLQGMMATVKGSAMTEISGGIVKIN